MDVPNKILLQIALYMPARPSAFLKWMLVCHHFHNIIHSSERFIIDAYLQRHNPETHRFLECEFWPPLSQKWTRIFYREEFHNIGPFYKTLRTPVGSIPSNKICLSLSAHSSLSTYCHRCSWTQRPLLKRIKSTYRDSRRRYSCLSSTSSPLEMSFGELVFWTRPFTALTR